MAKLITDQIDGNVSFTGGMNQGLHPSIIQDNQSRKNINASVIRGSISARPFYIELSDFKILSGDTRFAQGFRGYEEIFRKGRIQHAGEFNTSSGDYLILVISGIIYAVSLDACEAIVVEVQGSIDPKLLNYHCTRINGNQAGDYYILFDWPNKPIYIDSSLVAKRTDSKQIQIPRSYLGTFVHNRLFVANAGTEFGASDPVGPVNTTGSLPFLKPPISFTESIVDSDLNPSPPFADQFFSVSYIEKTSAITAMGYFYGITEASGTGFGPLFVSTDRSIQVFPVNQPRVNWANGFGQVLVFDKGIVGPKAFANVGDDVFYQAADCQIYSLKQIMSDQRQWGHVDISREVGPTVKTRNSHLLQYSDLEYYNNRLFVTSSPFITKAIDPYGSAIEDYSFSSLAVMEFHGASGLTSRGNPVWAGIYPGAFNCLVQVGDNFLSIGKDKTGTRNSIKLIDDSKNRGGDTLSVGALPVQSRVYTRQYDFEAPLNDKFLHSVVADFRNIKSSFKATVFYRTSPTCNWVELGDLSHKCEERCGIIEGVDTKSEGLCAHSNGEDEACFKCIEFRIDIASWDKDWELIKFYVVAERNPEISVDREMDVSLDKCDLLCRAMDGDLDLWE